MVKNLSLWERSRAIERVKAQGLEFPCAESQVDRPHPGLRARPLPEGEVAARAANVFSHHSPLTLLPTFSVFHPCFIRGYKSFGETHYAKHDDIATVFSANIGDGSGSRNGRGACVSQNGACRW